MMRRILAVLAIATMGMPAARADEPLCPKNPVLDEDFADPEILRTADGYLAFATNKGSRKVQVASSPDLKSWTVQDDALPKLPRWATPGWTWAPQVIKAGDHYALYFTAKNRETGEQCIGVATSKAPAGPFAPVSDSPFICQSDEGGSIDAAAFRDDDGSLHLVWKNDGNSQNLDTYLYMQDLTPNGTALLGTPRRLIKQDLPWEGALVEAPTLWKHDKRYFLFYSANAYSDERYAIGYASSDKIDGPYQKSQTPLLASGKVDGIDYIGPGGQSVLVDFSGQNWIAFHSWSPDHTKRVMNIASLDWKDGKPMVRLACTKPPSP